MSDHEYGGAVITPMKTQGELRVSIDGDVRYLTPAEARDLAELVGDAPENLTVLDDHEAFIDGLAAELDRL